MSVHRFSLHAKTNQQTGQPFRFTVAALDEGGRVDHGYAGTVQFASTDGNAELPPPFAFPGDGGGTAKLAVTFNSAGVHRLRVVDMGSGAAGESSAILVQATVPDFSLFWGDLHGHSRAWQFGLEQVDHFYTHARDVACLDFCALTECDALPESGWQIEPAWERLMRAVRYYHVPGSFVTFPGYEWTGGSTDAAFGHKQVLFLSDDEQPFSSHDARSDTPHKLWLCLAGRDAIAIPHHPAAPHPHSTDWERHDPEFEQLVEVYSSWGNSELPENEGNRFPIRTANGTAEMPGHYVQDVLARDFRLGFVAGSDPHDGQAYRGGLQGLYTTDLTRESLWDAMLAGRTYATTGARIVIEFSVNDEPMGSEVELLDEDLVRLNARVLGAADLEGVEVIKNNRVLYRHAGRGQELTLNTTDESEVESGDYYYLRVTQTDGHMAWTSPVWVE